MNAAARDAVVPAVDCFDVLGYGFSFVAGAAAARSYIRGVYGGFAIERPAAPWPTFCLEQRACNGSGIWELRIEDETIAGGNDLNIALDITEATITDRIVAHRGEPTVHAATVIGSRGASLIAGRSGAGKTTLCLALAARGYRVGGDDVALLSPETGQARPLPRCFHLDSHTRRLVRRAGLPLPRGRGECLTPAELGINPDWIQPIRSIFILEPGGSRGRPSVEPLTQAETVGRLFELVGWNGCTAEQKLKAIARVARGASCYRVARGTFGETARLVGGLLDSA